jgi:hypothetical protein
MKKRRKKMDIQSESLAYWYLRLNGFFTIRGFVVHPHEGNEQRTDIDIFGVRFPFRQELVSTHGGQKMDDDAYFEEINKPLVLLTEVKLSKCKINKSWTDTDRIHLFLSALGVLQPQSTPLDQVASEISNSGFFEDDKYQISYFCIGKTINGSLKLKYPNIKQITFEDVLGFIYQRFSEYDEPKRSHPQWDNDGKKLYETVIYYKKPQNGRDEFIKSVNVVK